VQDLAETETELMDGVLFAEALHLDDHKRLPVLLQVGEVELGALCRRQERLIAESPDRD
jgi:hypothetical protein